MDALSTACRPSTSNLLHWHNSLCQNFHQLPGWFPAQQHASRSCHYFSRSDMLQSRRSLVAVIIKDGSCDIADCAAPAGQRGRRG